MSNRSLRFLAAGMLVGTLLVTSVRSPACADSGETKSTSPKIRTAYVNLTVVVKGYERYKRFGEQVKEKVSEAEAKVKRYRRELESLAKEGTDPELTPEDRALLEKRMLDTQRRIEDITADGRSFVAKKTDEQLVTLYREIQEVVGKYARDHELEAVHHYNDAQPDSKDLYTPPNIARKMQAGALMPFYLAPEADITDKILKELNARYERGQ